MRNNVERKHEDCEEAWLLTKKMKMIIITTFLSAVNTKKVTRGIDVAPARVNFP